MPSSAEQLDSRTRVVTPENIAFEYRAAGPFARVVAYLLDIVIQLVVVFLTLFLFILLIGLLFAGAGGGGITLGSVLANLGGFAILVLWFLMQWFYGAWFEMTWNGQTPGKKALGLRVLQTNGRPIEGSQAVLRNLIRLLDAFPFLPYPEPLLTMLKYLSPLAAGSQLVALSSMTLTRRYQRLGDLACGTMVVAEERAVAAQVKPIAEPGVIELQETLPADFTPGRTLAKALSHYVGRRRYFGPARRQEIARHVGAVLIARLNLPTNTDCDLLLCALYNRAIHATAAELLERASADPPPSGAESREAAGELIASQT